MIDNFAKVTSKTGAWKPVVKKYMFTVGPGNVVSAYADWKSTIRTPTETSRTFSGLSLDFVRDVGARCLMVSHHPASASVEDGAYELCNIPKPATFQNHGVGYHLNQIAYGIRLCLLAKKNSVDAIIADSGTTHWFVWLFARLLGIVVVPNFHNVYYPVTNPPRSGIRRAISLLDGLFFRHMTPVALGVSPECGRQFSEIAGVAKQFEGYFSQFSKEDFEKLLPPDNFSSAVTILYVGRIEENKGVFDLLDIATQLEKSGVAFCVEVCGSGSSLEELKQRAAAAGISDKFHVRGKLERVELLKFYERAHMVVIPTRSSFTEGLPMVCAEAALAGRAVVTSRLSNALDVFGGAIMEAQPDDVASYVAAITKLINDRHLLAEMGALARQRAAVFTDSTQSLTAALHRSHLKGFL